MFGELLFSFDSLKLGISYKVKKMFAGICKETRTETGNRTMVGSFLPGKQPHTAGFLSLAE